MADYNSEQNKKAYQYTSELIPTTLEQSSEYILSRTETGTGALIGNIVKNNSLNGNGLFGVLSSRFGKKNTNPTPAPSEDGENGNVPAQDNNQGTENLTAQNNLNKSENVIKTISGQELDGKKANIYLVKISNKELNTFAKIEGEEETKNITIREAAVICVTEYVEEGKIEAKLGFNEECRFVTNVPKDEK